MIKRGKYSMTPTLGAVASILLGVAAVVLVVFSIYQIFCSRAKRSSENASKNKLQRTTEKDRALLELIGDLAELYRATGR